MPTRKSIKKPTVNDRTTRCNKLTTKYTVVGQLNNMKKQRKTKENSNQCRRNHFIEKENPYLGENDGNGDFKQRMCDTPNPGVPLTTCQNAEFLWISGDPIPHCCIPFIGIHIFKKNRVESPLFGELYPTYNLYNNIMITHPGS